MSSLRYVQVSPGKVVQSGVGTQCVRTASVLWAGYRLRELTLNAESWGSGAGHILMLMIIKFDIDVTFRTQDSRPKRAGLPPNWQQSALRVAPPTHRYPRNPIQP